MDDRKTNLKTIPPGETMDAHNKKQKQKTPCPAHEWHDHEKRPVAADTNTPMSREKEAQTKPETLFAQPDSQIIRKS